MKFTVQSKTLYNNASAVSKVINSKNALTILNNFLLVLEGTEVSLTGSDVENALTVVFPVLDPEGYGSYCIDARKLVDLLKELPNLPVTFDIDERTLEVNITYPGGDYSMAALPGDQYPQYQEEASNENPVEFQWPAEQFIKGIENTLFAVGTNDYHAQMMGILLDVKPEGIVFVATDTRKLVRYINQTRETDVTARAILPAKPANILKTVLPKEGDVNIKMTTKSAVFSTDSITFNCRFIKGNYPDYNKVIPTNLPYSLTIDRALFVNAVRRVSVFVDPGYGMEKFRISNDCVEIKSSDPNLRNAGNEQVKCEYQGPEIVIGFSAPYLIDVCNTLTTQDILMFLSDPSRPGVFRPTENEPNTDLLILLMPMSVTDF